MTPARFKRRRRKRPRSYRANVVTFDTLARAVSGMCTCNERRVRRVALAIELVTLAMASEARA